ncbi:hypothetical protein Pmar_PMAR018731, partial [Perkinsus marinus ATCC 50983]
ETPAFLHLRSLNGGGVLCPYSKGKLEAGYITIGVFRKKKYFYAVMEAEDVDPSLAPTFWYMAGEPGSSSLGEAMMLNGPCRMSPNGEELLDNTYSWTKQANGIWIDAPGPTGFSVGPIESTLEKFIDNMLDIMKTGLGVCKAAVDKCNSNGPGKPAKPVFCQEAFDTCEALTMNRMDAARKS